MLTVHRSRVLCLSAFALVAACGFCAAADSQPRFAISAAEAWRRLTGGERIAIVDVRDELERDIDGHIPNDASVPLAPKERFAGSVQQAVPDKSMTVFCYCKRGIVGGLSNQAAEIMAGVGYRSVYYISGGYDGWPHQKVKESSF